MSNIVEYTLEDTDVKRIMASGRREVRVGEIYPATLIRVFGPIAEGVTANLQVYLGQPRAEAGQKPVVPPEIVDVYWKDRAPCRIGRLPGSWEAVPA